MTDDRRRHRRSAADHDKEQISRRRAGRPGLLSRPGRARDPAAARARASWACGRRSSSMSARCSGSQRRRSTAGTDPRRQSPFNAQDAVAAADSRRSTTPRAIRSISARPTRPTRAVTTCATGSMPDRRRPATAHRQHRARQLRCAVPRTLPRQHRQAAPVDRLRGQLEFAVRAVPHRYRQGAAQAAGRRHQTASLST